MSAPPVAVVRHGRAGDRQSWDRDDRLRPLDGKGNRQAMALIDQLAPYRIERVVSSPYLRCIQTVLPLAVAARTAATLDDRLAEGAADRGVRELLGELAGARVAICTHGDVMLALVGRDAEARKGSTWLLDGDTLEPLEYLPPPAECHGTPTAKQRVARRSPRRRAPRAAPRVRPRTAVRRRGPPGQDHGAGQQGRGAALADAVGGGQLDRGALGQVVGDLVERLPAERPLDDPPQRAGAAAHRQGDVGGRRVEPGEQLSHLGPCGLDAALAGRVTVEHAAGQPQRADVDRRQPLGRPVGRPDGDLGRSAADVAHGERRRRAGQRRGGTQIRVAALVLRGQHARHRAGRALQLDHQIVRVHALPPRRGDDDAEVAAAQRPGLRGELASAVGGLGQLGVGDPAVLLDRRSEADLQAVLVDRRDRPRRGLGHEQAHRVRSDVDDADPHHP